MAIWQVDFALLPLGTLPVYGADGYEVVPFNAENAVAAQGAIDRRFGSPRELMDDWLIYGDENGNRFDLLLEESGTCFLARVDVRDAFAHVSLICEIAQILSCQILVVENKEIVMPEIQRLLDIVSGSRAARFVADPDAFLKCVARHGI